MEYFARSETAEHYGGMLDFALAELSGANLFHRAAHARNISKCNLKLKHFSRTFFPSWHKQFWLQQRKPKWIRARYIHSRNLSGLLHEHTNMS